MDKIYILDCLDRSVQSTQSPNASLGSMDQVTFRLRGAPPVLGMLLTKQGNCRFYPSAELKNYTLNGESMQGSAVLPHGKPCLLAAGGALVVVCYMDESQENILRTADPTQWLRYDASENRWVGPLTLANISGEAKQHSHLDYVVMNGLYDCMGRWGDVADIARREFPISTVTDTTPAPAASPAALRVQMFMRQNKQHAAPADSEHVVDEESGRYICPVCWLRFDAGDIMSIASHPDLMGDAILGRDSMKRFFAERFNARGQALDERGIPCTDLACPHCRRKLPPHFLEMDAKIFSIIGAPSSGKSYYLASLVHEMRQHILSDFNLAWRDSDPTGNTMLNEVANRLFSAETAEEAALNKTDLEGSLYEEFYRHGRMVKLPRPFIFDISKRGSRQTPASLIFYDNAGEHFEPGRNSEDSPGAQHVAVASGLFFLFDPTSSRPFRKLIGNKDDPQLRQNNRLDQQEIIMAETIARISGIRNMNVTDTVDTPLAIIIGKCDLWEDLLDTPLQPITRDGRLNSTAVKHNSDTIRRLLLKLHPNICAAAESFSSNVCYFAVSQLGCSPVTFNDPLTNSVKIGPDPKQLRPLRVCDPVYWVLSCITPNMVPRL